MSYRSKVQNRKTALYAALFALSMFGVAFAGYPLYRVFCSATGYGGTLNDAPVTLKDKTNLLPSGTVFTFRFNADIDKHLPWKFFPEQERFNAPVSGAHTAYFIAENLSDKPVKGRAVFNVVPHRAAEYIQKTECFCFTEQTLKPHERRKMGLLFVVDPAIMDDPFLKYDHSITFSYIFYPG